MTEGLRPESRLDFPGTLSAFEQIKIEPRLYSSRKPPTLADYLKSRHMYAEALPGNLRSLIDLRDYATVVARAEGARERVAPITRVLQRAWEIALQKSDLTPAETNALRDVIEIRTERPIHGVLEHLFRFDPRLSDIRPVETIHPLIRAACTVPLRWTCTRLRGAKAEEYLPYSIGAILMLATDTAVDAGYSSGFLDVDGARIAFGATYFGYSNDEHQAWYRFPLPIPNWHSFATFDRVAASLMDRMPSTQAEYDEHIRRLLQAIISACYGSTPTSPVTLDGWKGLAGKVAQMIDDKNVRDEGREWALSAAGLFGAPELGLSTKTAHEWLDALKKACGRGWAEVCWALQSCRAERCKKSVEAGPIARSAPSVAYVSAAEYLDSWAGLLDSTLEEHRTPVISLDSSDDGDEDISGDGLRAGIDHIVKKRSPHPWTEFVVSV